jgi:hypothetical protein
MYILFAGRGLVSLQQFSIPAFLMESKLLATWLLVHVHGTGGVFRQWVRAKNIYEQEQEQNKNRATRTINKNNNK